MSEYPPIAQLVPHEPPMLAVEELVSCEKGKASGRLTVRDGLLFVRDGQLDTVITLEYMAQTVAACLGYEAINEGGAVRVGMVVACRAYQLHRPRVAVGETLLFEVERVQGTADMSQFDGRTLDEQGALVAEVSMTLVHTERPPGLPDDAAYNAGAVGFGGLGGGGERRPD